jgi:hypothetical protein
MRVILRKYWIEILVFLGLLAGIFLLTEQMNIRGLLFGFLKSISEWSEQAIEGGIERVQVIYRGIQLSDAIGIAVVLAAVVVLLLRMRFRFQESENYTGRICPKCGSVFLRVHRTTWDRVLGKVTFIRFRRYRCSNRECGWEGRRKPGRRQKPINGSFFEREEQIESG